MNAAEIAAMEALLRHSVFPRSAMLLWLALAGPLSAEPAVARVGVLHAVRWSPADAARAGAGELEVLLCVAQLRAEGRLAGLVSVGDRNGARPGGGESALELAALTGVPVAKLAPGGRVAAAPRDLFLDAGSLSAEETARVLERCLRRYGAPPAAADPDRPSPRELAAIRAHLASYRAALAQAQAPRLAAD